MTDEQILHDQLHKEIQEQKGKKVSYISFMDGMIEIKNEYFHLSTGDYMLIHESPKMWTKLYEKDDTQMWDSVGIDQELMNTFYDTPLS